MARWLGQFGYEVTVITASPGPEQEGVIRIPDTSVLQQLRSRAQATRVLVGTAGESNAFLSRFKSMLRPAMREFMHWFDCHFGWSARAVKVALKLAKTRQCDLVWTTCDPFAMAHAARRIGQACHIPYVIDFRDPPPEYLRAGKPKHWLARAVRDAAAVTVAAPVCVNQALIDLFPDRAFHPIISGAWQTGSVTATPGFQFRLFHAAGPSLSQRNPSTLFRAMHLVAKHHPEFRVDARLTLVGPGSQQMVKTEGFNLIADMCDLIPEMPYAKAVKMMRESALLVIIKGEADAVSRDAIPGKFLDYLPFEAPILAVGGVKGILGHLLDWTGCGRWIGTPEEAAEFINYFYQAWKNRDVISTPRNAEALAYLTQRRMAGEFAEVFQASIDRRPVRARDLLPWQTPIAKV
ncbi:MAG: glycosyltransferase family protein [Armatimonadota bacterium]